MSALGIDIDLSTDFLEDRLTDNCKCQIAHNKTTCEIVVVAIRKTCQPPILICANGVRSTYAHMTDEVNRCGHCARPCFVCWSVVAI